MKRYSSFINGEFVSGDNYVKLNRPNDGQPFASVSYADQESARYAIDSAYEAYDKWSFVRLQKRKQLLLRLSDLMQSRSEEYVSVEMQNTGKTVRQTTFMDVPLAIEHVKYFALEKEFHTSRRIKHPEYPDSSGTIQHVPMGVVAAIAPWNVPLLMAVWKIAPAVLAGNTVVLKTSRYTPASALEMAEDISRAGFPKGVINIIPGKGSDIGKVLTKSEKVGMISFTGSTETGKEIIRDSSNSIKKISLELGGKSPNIVFADADLESAAKGVIFSIFLNSGQLCESGSRLIVDSGISESFVGKLKEKMLSLRDGDPAEFTTDISAITTLEQKQKIAEMVQESTDAGSQLLAVKDIVNSPAGGIYYPPTMLQTAQGKASTIDEEIFGPVLSVDTFRNEEEAILKANNTRYGLAASVWSNDIRKAKRVASGIKAGTVWINQYHLLSAAAPRGGFKESGVGRELGLEGILETTQTRHVFINGSKSDLDNVAYGLLLPEGKD